MESQNPKIVVITPVKNEAWILDRFLAVTSQFADHIIIADQNSTDGSQAICKNYPKVTLIENKSDQFNEADRQLLLIHKARELVPEPKILFALDADELLAANAIKTLGWQSILKSKPGTVLCLERADLYLTPYQVVRHDTYSPIGYVDDGAEHKPRPMHSIRIPMPDYAPRLYCHDLKIIHYALIRPNAYASKIRLYSVLENILSIGKFPMGRRQRYASKQDFTKTGRLELTPSEWFAGWEELGIDMRTIFEQVYYWYDFEVLNYFQKYGLRRFWLDDIWEFDWEDCRLYAKSVGLKNIPDFEISEQPRIINILAGLLTALYNFTRKLNKPANYKTKLFK
jgi:glycosyltransferase involved in cell wall biosynthesis